MARLIKPLSKNEIVGETSLNTNMVSFDDTRMKMNSSFEIHRDTITKLAHKNKSYRGLAVHNLNSTEEDDRKKKCNKKIILPKVARGYKNRGRKVIIRDESKQIINDRMLSVDSSMHSFENLTTSSNMNIHSFIDIRGKRSQTVGGECFETPPEVCEISVQNEDGVYLSQNMYSQKKLEQRKLSLSRNKDSIFIGSDSKKKTNILHKNLSNKRSRQETLPNIGFDKSIQQSSL